MCQINRILVYAHPFRTSDRWPGKLFKVPGHYPLLPKQVTTSTHGKRGKRCAKGPITMCCFAIALLQSLVETQTLPLFSYIGFSAFCRVYSVYICSLLYTSSRVKPIAFHSRFSHSSLRSPGRKKVQEVLSFSLFATGTTTVSTYCMTVRRASKSTVHLGDPQCVQREAVLPSAVL